MLVKTGATGSIRTVQSHLVPEEFRCLQIIGVTGRLVEPEKPDELRNGGVGMVVITGNRVVQLVNAFQGRVIFTILNEKFGCF